MKRPIGCKSVEFGSFLVILLGLGCICVSRPAAAQLNLKPLTITVQPGTPTTADDVVIRHDLTFNTGGYQIGGSDFKFLTPNDIVIDVFVRGPDLGDPVTQAITFLDVESNLGMLPAGDYHYTSRVVTIPRSQFPNPPSEAVFTQFPPGIRTGQFTVVPEPASLTLLAIGGWAFTRRRRPS